jgi:CSLREA domain-containing protein
MNSRNYCIYDQSHKGYAVIVLLALLGSGCTLQVDSTADAPDVNPGDGACARAAPPLGKDQGLCTLRAAVMEANATIAAERIEIPAGTYVLDLPSNQGGGPLVIDRSVAIRGAGVGSTIIDAAANQYDGGEGCPNSGAERRIFTINDGNVSIRYATLRGGFAQHGGGLRQNGGELEITDAAIQRNVAFTGGGGAYLSGGVARIRRTSIIENCATGAFGGGLRTSPDAQVWVYDSLIANNRSNRAGGVYNLGALNLRSTTISGNVADSPSAGTGGLSQNGFAVLNNVTMTNNVGRGTDPNSFLGGGIATFSSSLSVVKNSIIAGNDGQGGPNDCSGALTFDSRNNLIGDSNGCDISGFLFTYILDVDAQIAPLALNGGPTRTHSLLTGSPARESAYEFPPPAADACEARDQRGVPRPQGSGRCDMGAFESGHANTFVTGFVLVNADTDTDLFSIRNGELLNLGLLPDNLSIRANVGGAAGSVVFAFDANATFQTENNSPYALGGDAPAGDYLPVTFTPGNHTLRATPFAAANGSGAAGGSLEVQFYVFGE